jgi:MoxR-like ATPase
MSQGSGTGGASLSTVVAEHPLIARLVANIGRALLGKEDVIRTALVGLLADGHILIEDVPGVGKTLLARALAKSIGGSFRRVQFTPDLLPSDILGTNVYNAQTASFAFKPGPIFANVVLADEINRTTPRTQSALLEAMNDRQVSIDGVTHHLPRPFLVLATQNPFEFEGTYPLPESQLDRFMLRVRVGYPARSEELRMLREHREGEPIDRVEALLSPEQVLQLQAEVRKVEIHEDLAAYLLNIVEATRKSEHLAVGASPRAALSLYRAAQAAAFMHGRDYVIPDDIKELAVPVLAHRLIASAQLYGVGSGYTEQVIREIVDSIPVPD